MKKFLIITLIFVLTASIFTGCRRMGDTNPTTAPSSSGTTGTVAPMPALPLPSGTNTTGTHGATTPDGVPEVPGRMIRPSAKEPRY